jgi:phthalate 4,5-dioxygenase oxygenase subunit
MECGTHSFLETDIDANAQRERRGLVLDEDLRKLKNMDNNYDQDRELMKVGNYSGIRGIANQDHAVTESMGPIVDRAKEHLGTSDLPLIQMRRILLDSVKGFMQLKPTIRLQDIKLGKLYSCGMVAPKGKKWSEVIPLDNEFVFMNGKDTEETGEPDV